MKIILYIKTHNKTGLKYFGKTIRDPYKYKGSGTRWLYHLKKHGNDVITEIYGSYTNVIEAKQAAKEFSIRHNIVESDEWANIIPENLEGAQLFGALNGRYKKPMTEEHKNNLKKTYEITGHAKGEKNSQYGTMWINNGLINKKMKKEGDIPPGWAAGRLPVKGSFLPGPLNPRYRLNQK